MPCSFLTFLSSQSYTVQKGLTVYSSWARHRWKDWWNMLWHPKAPVTTWMQQLKPKASSVKDISWNTRGMLYQLNIITLMVTVTHFKSTGRNQGDHFSIDLHEHSTKLIFIYWHIYLFIYIYIYSGAVHLKLTQYCISTILQLKIKNKRAIQNIKNKCITF